MTVAGFIFFSVLEPVFVKYTLAAVVGGLGAFVALVPVGGRPFDKWFMAFVRAVFAPTQRVWIKEKQIPEFLNVVTSAPKDDKIPEEITEKSKERLVAYLKSLPKDNQSPLDAREAMAISHINFDVGEVGEASTRSAIMWPVDFETKERSYPVQKKEVEETVSGVVGGALGEPIGILPFEEGYAPQPSSKPKVREEKGQKRPEIKVPYVYAPKVQQSAKAYSLHGLEDRLRVSHGAASGGVPKPKMDRMHILRKPRLRAHLASDGNFDVDNIISVMEPDNHVRFVRGVGKTRVRKLHFAPPANFDLSNLPIRGERRFEISEELKRRFNFEDNSPQVVLPNEKSTMDTKVNFDPTSASHTISQVLPRGPKQVVAREHAKKEKVMPVADAKAIKPVEDPSAFSITDNKQQTDFQSASQGAQIIPLTDKPNVISGLVTDSTGAPIEGAVLVLRDSGGIPVRALKANKLGQFLSATPLPSGTYTIEVESDLATFRAAWINLSGQIVSPIGLVAEARTN